VQTYQLLAINGGQQLLWKALAVLGGDGVVRGQNEHAGRDAVIWEPRARS